MAAAVVRLSLPSFRPTKGMLLCLTTHHPGGPTAAHAGSTTIRLP
jgi:hypothetical protein